MGRLSESERWCPSCERSVVVLSAMSESEARSLLAARKGTRTCIAYRVGADGQVRFSDHALALAGWALVTVLAATGCMGFESQEFETLDDLESEAWPSWSVTPVAKPERREPIEPAVPASASPDPGRIIVMVFEMHSDEPIPGAIVRISSRLGELSGRTDHRGVWQLDEIVAGTYLVEVGEGWDSRSLEVRLEPGGLSKVLLRQYDETELILGDAGF
jgi:hypothetical protein